MVSCQTTPPKCSISILCASGAAILLTVIIIMLNLDFATNKRVFVLKEVSNVEHTRNAKHAIHDDITTPVAVAKQNSIVTCDDGSIQHNSTGKSSHTRNSYHPIMLYGGFDDFQESTQIVGATEGAANIIFYMWCGKGRLFEFKHMLSVLSSLKVHQPLKVILYHWKSSPPLEDLYNNWLTEIKETFFNFEVSEIPEHINEPQNCSNTYMKSQYITRMFRIKSLKNGGIYVDENVILLKALNQYRTRSVTIARSNGVPCIIVEKRPKNVVNLAPSRNERCISYKGIDLKSNAACASMDFDKIYPHEIMTSDGEFYALARQLFYGSPEKKEPVQDLLSPIPNIGHFYLVGENTINLFIYLSIYSMISVLKVDMIYLHTDLEPNGDYWKKLKDTRKIKFVFCPPVQTVFGNRIDSDDKFHGKDVLSVYFLYIYGGVFIDWDAVFTRPLDDAVRGYDAVIGYDWLIPDEAPTFPAVINPGVMAARRHSVFLSMWLERYKDFGKGGFYYTGLLVPYKLYEHYPETVKLDVRFQVICWMDRCHPPWMDGYTKPEFHSEFDWENVYAVHFTYPDPIEYYSEEVLRNSTTFFGKIGQNVMGWL